jgi:hypothetical protein
LRRHYDRDDDRSCAGTACRRRRAPKRLVRKRFRKTSSARPPQSIAAVDAAIFYQEVDAFSAAGLLALPASRY